MPYGHIRQYRELVEEAQSKRLQITKRQRQQIAKLYRDIAKDMGKEISKKSEKALTYRWLKDYAKALKSQSRQLYDELQGIISLGIWDTAQAVSAVEMEFWGGIVPELSERFRDTFSAIPQTCVDELMNGGIYKDFTGLSERLWNYKQKYDRDIGYIIDRGIVEQKSAYDLAKDLEMYVDPSARKPWEWRKVYPYSNQAVDYNAQRLARTSVTHAYQMSFQRSTVDNPFIEKYKWHSSNAGKTCELCRQRDGKTYDKNMVPLDHPNGMCIVTAEIPKSMDEIAEELSSWASGGSNPALDKWLGKSDMEGDFGDKLHQAMHPTLRKQLTKFERQLKKVENPNVITLLSQAKERVTFRQTNDKVSYFSAKDNMVSISAEADTDSIAHELFHEIDATYGITQNGALKDSLQKDYKKLIVSARASGKSIPEMLYSVYPEIFEGDGRRVLPEYRGVADILNGLSAGNIWLGFSHNKMYWKKKDRLEAEAWAQFGRILFMQNGEVLNFMQRNFPNTYAEVIRIIERMIK